MAAFGAQFIAVDEQDFEIKDDDSDLVRGAKLATKATDWVVLPGDSSWWEDYDHVEHGFVPDGDPESARRAYDLVTDWFPQMPEDAYLLAPSNSRLYMLNDDVAEYQE